MPDRDSPLNNRPSLITTLPWILVVLCIASGAFAQTLDLVYINANIGACPTCVFNPNRLIAYNLHTDTGQLVRLNGPFNTGGTGIYRVPPGNEIDADQLVIVNKAGTLIFSVNAHTNTIAVDTINSDGSITPVPGTPFSSNGHQPASLGLLEDPNIGGGNSILVVANKDSDPGQPATSPNYSTFLVSPTGVLTLNAGSKYSLPTGASPTQALINQTGDLLLGMEYYGFGGIANLTSYRIDTDGILTPITTVNPPNGGTIFLGEAQNPVTSVLYAGVPDKSTIGVYQVGTSTGDIVFNNSVTNPAKPGWMAINRRGTRLYVSENSSNSVTVYKTSNSLSPVQLQHLTLQSGGSYGATSIALDATEKYVLVITGTTIHTLTVQSDGTLAEIVAPHPLPIPAGTQPTGLVSLLK